MNRTLKRPAVRDVFDVEEGKVEKSTRLSSEDVSWPCYFNTFYMLILGLMGNSRIMMKSTRRRHVIDKS